MKNQITNYLLDHVIKPHYKGFNYAVSAIQIIIQADTYLPIKSVYTMVSEEYGVSWQCVERCIRTLIEASWRTKMPIRFIPEKPTNAEFIMDAATHIKLLLNGGDEATPSA